MNVETLLRMTALPVGDLIEVEGILMTRGRHPFLGRSTSDWSCKQCLRLTDNGLCDRLINLLFPHIIAGGDTLFFYPSIIVGILAHNPKDGMLALTELRSIQALVDDELYEQNNMLNSYH